MIRAGLVDEVRALMAGGGLGRQASEALGYRQIIDHLEGRVGRDGVLEQIRIRTRRFAKQQRSWLRRFRIHPESSWILADGLSAQELVDKAFTAAIGSGQPAAFREDFLDEAGLNDQILPPVP